jgi:Tannase and feruloyl esterase
MKMAKSIGTLWSIGFVALVLSSGAALAANCADMVKFVPPHAQITATSAEGGNFTSPKDGIGNTTKVTLSFCRITGVAHSVPGSEIHFEVWLPPADKWNGRMLTSGDLGHSGVPNYPAMNDALTRGFAAVGDDLGHQSNAFAMNWAAGHPTRLVDWGYRASHFTAIAGKAIIAAYYGRPASHAYFTGCSHGGGTALGEAERYPADYDGIIAGDFGSDWTDLSAAYVYEAQVALNDPASKLSPAKINLVRDAAIRACDALDGVKDGIINDPRQCHFDPAVLQCKAGDGPNCLTKAQVTTVRGLYAGPRNSEGRQVFPGLDPGSEFQWGFIIAGPNTFLGADFFKYAVYDGGDFDWHHMSLDRDVDHANEKIGRIVNNDIGYLGEFEARGGKLILYTGWADALINSRNAIDYYESVEAMEPKTTSQFTRLYMAPGMGHCAGGPGPNAFGGTRYLNAGQPNPPELDRRHDLISAILAWVEKGDAPGAIIATKFKDDDASKGIAMQRPLCPFPEVAKYQGHGNTNEATSFSCARP